jgi:aspartyl-tRNA(Asn)/glutamyl-tRNA(Gln) amidotransferase subunit C
MSLSAEEVKHIAALARIGLADEEIPKYQKDLSAILDYFKKLQELDTDNIEPIGHITGRVNSYREDKMEDFGDLGKEAIFKNTPEKKDNFVKVKSVL